MLIKAGKTTKRTDCDLYHEKPYKEFYWQKGFKTEEQGDKFRNNYDRIFGRIQETA